MTGPPRGKGVTPGEPDTEQAVSRRSAVTEARIAELRQSEEKYRYAAELAGLIVWTADAQGEFLSISARFTELTGLAPGPQRRAMHPEDRDGVMSDWHASVAAGRPHMAEFRMRVRDGSYRHFRARSAPRLDTSGRIVGWYGFTEDIHERKQAEIARAESEERYRLAIRATNDALYDLDLVSREIRWRDTAAEFFGHPAQHERTALTWWEEKVHPDDRGWVVRGLEQIMASDRNRWAIDYKFRKADGDYADVHDQGFIVRDSKGRALRAVGAMTDVTRHRQAEAKVERMQAELIHMSRLNAMGTMASTLAHELNQPLAAASNFISGARKLARKDDPGSRRQLLAALEAAGSSAVRAGEIVRRLRELVSRGTASAAAEHLPGLIDEACILAFVDARHQGVGHRIELDPDAEWVWVDRIQIQQVLINLVRNAIEAMEDSPVREVLISTHRLAGDMAEIRVADTGSGIQSENVEDLFSRFVTTKSGGMGVGLPISRTIVEAHGGKIWAASSDKGGAVFCFTLPISPRKGKKRRRS